MCKFLMICVSILSLFGLVSPNNNPVNNRNSLRASNNSEYQQGYNDGYNAALSGSIFDPSNFNIVLTLPSYETSTGSYTSYWPIGTNSLPNIYNNFTLNFDNETFFDNWLSFFDDSNTIYDYSTQYNYQFFIDFKSPVPLNYLNFSAYGFGAIGLSYVQRNENAEPSISWFYATGNIQDYNINLNFTIEQDNSSTNSLLIDTIFFQFPMSINSSTEYTLYSSTLSIYDNSYTAFNKGYDLGETSGFNSGFSAGESSGYDKGYHEAEDYYNSLYNQLMDDYLALNENYNSLLESDYSLQKLFWAIGSTPFETFKTIWNVEFLGINLASFITRTFLW